MVLAMAGLLAGVACSSPMSNPQPQVKSGEDLVIGVPVNTTGALSQEGALTKQGYEVWLDWANHDGGIVAQGVRHRVRLVYEDEQSTAQGAGQATEKLITEGKAQFLLGPYGSVDAAGVATVAEKHRVPVVAPSAGARQVFQQGFHYLFGMLPPADTYPAAVIDMENAVAPKANVAMLYADDPYSLEAAKAAIDYGGSHGQTYVFTQKYPTGTTNLYPILQQAKAKNPDILVNIGHLLEAVAMMKAARDVRLDAKLFVANAGADAPEFMQALGPAAEGVITGSPWTAEAKYKSSYYLSTPEYVAAYRKKFSTDQAPTFITADATAAAVALQAAIEHAGALDGDRVREALAALDLNTFYGEIKFDANGQAAAKRLLVEQIQKGRPVTVFPPELAPATPLAPMTAWETRLSLPPSPPPAKLPGTGKPRGR
jgi:branched-chain amino acid transport system substrate-binding protein